jgi:hypothetical protein
MGEVQLVSWIIGSVVGLVGMFGSGYTLANRRNGYIKRSEMTRCQSKREEDSKTIHGKIDKISQSVARIEGYLQQGRGGGK